MCGAGAQPYPQGIHSPAAFELETSGNSTRKQRRWLSRSGDGRGFAEVKNEFEAPIGQDALAARGKRPA
jgi:hypothetical protein